MSTSSATTTRVVLPYDPKYPARDGKPMSDNTRQFEWITTVQGGIDTLFADRPDVWIAGNCLWYPVEDSDKIRIAPDTMVVFDRPRGHCGPYVQHKEDGIAPQVAFEVLSPGNRAGEMRRKLKFYETYGVEEYYILDPDDGWHKGYLRDPAGKFQPIVPLRDWVSPRLGIRFETINGLLHLTGPDGRPLESYVHLHQQRGRWEQQAERAQREAERERLGAERLRAQLRALGMEPED